MKLTKEECSILAILSSMAAQEFLSNQDCTREKIQISAKTIEELSEKLYQAGKDKRRQGRTSVDSTGRKLARLAKRYGILKSEQTKIEFTD